MAGGGEEMLRLRAYEKLQNFVQAGMVKKVGKEYRGVGSAIETFLRTADEANSKTALSRSNRPVTVEAKS